MMILGGLGVAFDLDDTKALWFDSMGNLALFRWLELFFQGKIKREKMTATPGSCRADIWVNLA